QPAAFKVLAVDDDPAVLGAVEALVATQPIALYTLGDPLDFWRQLEAVQPDLVMLDVDMPFLSGIELCRVLRNDMRWGAVPVLFLTARTDADSIQRIFAAGADDYVSKPLVGPELLGRLHNRLERTRLHRRMAELERPPGALSREETP
ncbi:MAG: PleD family two-component system response regulator, partial [Candidatus Sericytochromatia bacterium]